MPVYSVWKSHASNKMTLVVGAEPLVYIDGTRDPDCDERVYQFSAKSWAAAEAAFTKFRKATTGFKKETTGLRNAVIGKYPHTMKILDYVLEIEGEGFEDTVQGTCQIPEGNLWYVAMLANIELTGQVKYFGHTVNDKKKLDQLIRKAFNLEEER